MNKILWQTRSQLVYDSLKSGELINGVNGGNAYDFQAASVLKSRFDVAVDTKALFCPTESILSYWFKMFSYQPDADVIIKEPYPIVFGKVSKRSKNVAMIHHIDDDFSKKTIKHHWFINRLKEQLKKVDLVITVSKYWEDYLLNLGCKKIKVIYNSFNLKDYSFPPDEIIRFKLQYGLSNGQPIIYIGNADRLKGVYEVYDALRNKPYQLVMSGSKNNANDLPLKFLCLNRHDYLCLLSASDIVITLSNMREGWNRIAHEALLSNTPVIGSGRGGMKELLEGADQKIVIDRSSLLSAVEDVLKNKTFYSKKGFDYVKKYDNIYFKNEWIKTINELINQ